MAGALLIGGVSAAHAALTTPTCLAKKLKAWGKLRQCQRNEEAKANLGKAFDLAKCQTKFADTSGKLDAQGTAAGVACRYIDNGQSITDTKTGLMWEKKSSLILCSNVHCVGDVYLWTDAMSTFVSQLNGYSGTTNPTEAPGFEGRNDWRLPSIDELSSILDTNATGCGGGTGPCIDPIFGPTSVDNYWSAITYSDTPANAWVVSFDFGVPLVGDKGYGNCVRGVRSGL
jgi:hypothetical protein